MAALLRQIVAGPRTPHPEAGLDLCYVTDFILATSGPSSTYPSRAYRNPTDDLVKFLDSKHGKNWAIWEFRAEGTGYPDSEVYGRVHHFPWPDHHPPPFALIPNIMASMRNWLMESPEGEGTRIVVVHCKAGKGRSGTIATSYLISQEGWKVEDALARFTERRMRPGFGPGVSIPSQLRWVGYVDYWTKHEKKYLERAIEIVEVHIWGLREGVKVSIQGYENQGKAIKTVHTFSSNERLIIDAAMPSDRPIASKLGLASEQSSESTANSTRASTLLAPVAKAPSSSLIDGNSIPEQPDKSHKKGSEPGGKAVIFRPATTITIPASDVCIDVERRNRAAYGWTLVTAVARVWFNVYFEGRKNAYADPSKGSDLEAGTDRGVFEIDWDGMDGIKGSSRKGVRAFDKMAVVWRAIGDSKDGQAKEVEMPKIGEPVLEAEPAHWAGAGSKQDAADKKLGVRAETMASAGISKASSVKSNSSNPPDRVKEEARDELSDYEDSIKGVKRHGVGVENDSSNAT